MLDPIAPGLGAIVRRAAKVIGITYILSCAEARQVGLPARRDAWFGGEITASLSPPDERLGSRIVRLRPASDGW